MARKPVKTEAADSKRGRPASVSDAELMATGEATKAQIAKLFRRDPKTLDRLLYGLIPAGVRRGVNTYSIEEAAQRLVKPGYQIETYIRRMHHTDLPNLLQKEFWNGLRARQAYEKEQGDLWQTAEIVAAFAAAAGDMRMKLLLMPDDMERDADLSARQKEVCKRLTDAMIVNIQEALVDRFSDYEPPADQYRIPDPESVLGDGPARGYDTILDAEDHQEAGVGVSDDWGDDLPDGEEDPDDPGTIDDL